MEPRDNVANRVAVSPERHAVKKNINYMLSLSLGLRVLEFILNIIAFSFMASTKQKNVIYSFFILYM
uniref:Uncharacterized protein n=1 Tax=Physcomitrium patens TaxID=3218 RepID=A0A2K1IBJ4_PHYPA|nr:hypothetical protein PHYPA_030126 [Physcomitrium patens]